jgi:hypothetical protein
VLCVLGAVRRVHAAQHPVHTAHIFMSFFNKIKFISTAIKDLGLQFSGDMTVNDFNGVTSVVLSARWHCAYLSLHEGCIPRMWAAHRLLTVFELSSGSLNFLQVSKKSSGRAVQYLCRVDRILVCVSDLQLWNVAAYLRETEKWYTCAICGQCVQLTAADCTGNDWLRHSRKRPRERERERERVYVLSIDHSILIVDTR